MSHETVETYSRRRRKKTQTHTNNNIHRQYKSVDLETVQFFAPDVAINLTDLQQFLNEREDNRIDRIYNGDRSIFNFDTINDDITIQQTKYTVLLQNLILLRNEIDSYV